MLSRVEEGEGGIQVVAETWEVVEGETGQVVEGETGQVEAGTVEVGG